MLRAKKGFLLLEVIVSIAIITGGLVFVTRVYSTAKYAIQRSFILFKSALLLESRMFEFEEKGKIESDFKDGGTFKDDKDYSWSMSSAAAPRDELLGQDLNLDIVTLEVTRTKDTKEKKSYITKYFLTTYLNDKKNK